MKFGKYTYGNPEIQWPDSKLVVGKFCSIAKNVKIYLGGNHNSNWVSTYPFGHIHKGIFNKFNGVGHPTSKGNVNIGNDVWIGENVTIMSGVSVGDGSIIANNSHVVKNVEPYSIIGGNPAKLIKYRFTEQQMQQLLEIKWWDWEDAKINDFSPLLSSGNIDEFITSAKKTSRTLNHD